MAWTGQTFTVGQTLTAAQMNNLQADITALANGDSGAPSITQAALGASSVGQSEIKTTTGTVSGQNDKILPGGQYGFYPRCYWSASDSSQYIAMAVNTGATGSYAARIDFYTAAGNTGYGHQRYLTASNPYILNPADGECWRFIFLEIDNTTSDVVGVYNANEAPWHYNGPTDIRGHAVRDLHNAILKVRKRKDMSSCVIASLDEALLDNATLQQYIDAFTQADEIDQEITQAIKNADMDLIPHPFTPRNGISIIMLDPLCDDMGKLAEMCEKHDEFNLNQLFHEQRFSIGIAINITGPRGVPVHKFKLK